MNVTAYHRVSTNDQAESGAGLAAQAAAIEAFAVKAGHAIVATFTDAGISGAAGIEDRPGLMAAVAGLRRGDALVIAKRDRLGRDPMAVLMIERAVAKRGAVILCADGIGNETDANGQFMKAIIDAAAAYERNLIRARTKAALAAKRKAGQRTGEVPFGWTVDDAGNLIPVAAEQVVLDRIHALRDAGVSMNRIAAVLTEAGILTKKGRTKWYAETIRSILDRAAALAA
jgi:DNA invertase Pin-like site-specific DNA recombinase